MSNYIPLISNIADEATISNVNDLSIRSGKTLNRRVLRDEMFGELARAALVFVNDDQKALGRPKLTGKDMVTKAMAYLDKRGAYCKSRRRERVEEIADREFSGPEYRNKVGVGIARRRPGPHPSELSQLSGPEI